MNIVKPLGPTGAHE